MLKEKRLDVSSLLICLWIFGSSQIILFPWNPLNEATNISTCHMQWLLIHSINSLLKLSATFSRADHTFYLKTPPIFNYLSVSNGISSLTFETLSLKFSLNFSIHLSDSSEGTQDMFYVSSKSTLVTLLVLPNWNTYHSVLFLLIPIVYKILL